MNSDNTSEITCKDAQNSIDKEILLALYEKRLELFNVRRGHEWQVLIAVITLIIAVDAGLLSSKINLDSEERLVWSLAIGTLALACICFEFQIQRRNRVDRIVLFNIQKLLCEKANLGKESNINLPPDYHKAKPKKLESFQDYRLRNPEYWFHFLWAFLWQFIVLAFISLLSIYIVPRVAERIHNEQAPQEVSKPATSQGNHSNIGQ